MLTGPQTSHGTLHPEGNADAYAILLADDAFYHSGQNRDEDAIADMRRAIRLCKHGVRKMTLRMILSKAVHIGLLIEGEYPFHDAVEQLERLTLDEDYSPEQAVLLSVRAFLLAREERFKEALETADRAWESGKKNLGQIDALYLLGRLAAVAAEANDKERTKNGSISQTRPMGLNRTGKTFFKTTTGTGKLEQVSKPTTSPVVTVESKPPNAALLWVVLVTLPCGICLSPQPGFESTETMPESFRRVHHDPLGALTHPANRNLA